ncbi:MAG: endonuclease III [Chitinivibrionales bacterium]|nr:endonuclease III [Chitinivibrionales bacterium]
MGKKTSSIDTIMSRLARHYQSQPQPVAESVQSQTNDPFKVLLTAILSSRTKDATTAIVVKKLFAAVSTMQDLRQIPINILETLLYPVGFYKTKAKQLKLLPDAIDSFFHGTIPQDVETLCNLPGVGRKVANLVVAVAFNKPAICVDTHVHRICNRIGYIATTTPLETEMTLRQKLPGQYWIVINSYLVSFGQHICLPINPLCPVCPISDLCRRVGVKTKHHIPTQTKAKESFL